MTSIPAIHTSCKNCVFSIYENITQTGCHLDHINKYKLKNIQILEAYDDDKEFYVIANKKCPSYREDTWFKDKNLTIQEKIEQVKLSNTINYLVVINLKTMSLDQYTDILNQISILTFKPNKIIIVRYTDDNQQFPFEKLQNDLASVGIPWRIQTIVDKDATLGDIVHQISNSTYKQRFICHISNFTTDIEKIVNTANNIICEDLSSFNILSNKSKDIILYSGAVYRYANFHGFNILNDQEYYQIV